MAAVQGLYVEIDFKFKNELLLKGINEAKKALKNLGVDFQNVQKNIQKSGYRAGEVFKKINKDVSKTAQTMNKTASDINKSFNKVNGTKIDKPLDDFNKKAKQSVNLTNNLQKGINNIARGAAYKVGAMAVQGMQEGFKGVADVDFNIRGAVAKTGTMAQGYKEMLSLANEVGGKTKFNNLDAALAINSAATLGLMDKEIKELLPSTADLAQAFNSDLNKTLESTIAYIKTYNMETSEAVRVNDMVAMVSKKSAADLDRLQAGFQYVGSTAKSMNIPLESTFAVLGKLNDSGIYGSSAGTALNNFLVQMAKNAPDIEKLIGDKLTDKNGKLKALPDIFQKVADKVRNLDDTTRSAVLFDLFGIRGGKNILTFLNQGVEGLKELEAQIKKSDGTVNEMARFMMQGIGGAIEELGSTWETAFQSVFQALEPLLMPIFIGLTSIGDVIIQLNKHFPELAQAIGTIAGLVIGKAVFKLMAKQIGMVKAALSGAMTLKMLALAAALFIVYQGIKRFKEALEKDKEAAVQWQKVVENAKGVLKELANIILDVIKAMFGFSEEKNKLIGDGPNKNPSSDLALFLNDVREALRKTQEKLEEFRDWIEKHKETFKKLGKFFKDWGPAILGSGIALFLILNPLWLIPIAVPLAIGALDKLNKALDETKDSAKKLKEDGDLGAFFEKEWKKLLLYTGTLTARNPGFLEAYDNYKNLSPERKQNITKQNSKTTIAGSLLYSKLPVSPAEMIYNKFKEIDWTGLAKKIYDSLNYVFFGGLASDLGTKVGEKIRSINWSGLWDSVVNIAKSKWDSFVQWVFGKISELKEKFPLLAQGLNAFHNALEVAKRLLREIMNFSGKVITITLNFIKKGEVKNIVNDVVNESKNGLDFGNNLLKPKGTYVGTNHFSGGITAINEKGDELIIGPTGMIVANNPSTINIMHKLNSIEARTSQMKFRMNDGNSGGNNITINIANINNKSDADYLIKRIENLSLS